MKINKMQNISIELNWVEQDVKRERRRLFVVAGQMLLRKLVVAGLVIASVVLINIAVRQHRVNEYATARATHAIFIYKNDNGEFSTGIIPSLEFPYSLSPNSEQKLWVRQNKGINNLVDINRWKDWAMFRELGGWPNLDLFFFVPGVAVIITFVGTIMAIGHDLCSHGRDNYRKTIKDIKRLRKKHKNVRDEFSEEDLEQAHKWKGSSVGKGDDLIKAFSLICDNKEIRHSLRYTSAPIEMPYLGKTKNSFTVLKEEEFATLSSILRPSIVIKNCDIWGKSAVFWRKNGSDAILFQIDNDMKRLNHLRDVINKLER